MRARFFGLLTVPFLLTGCESVMDAGNNLGHHMPTIGADTCESSECITASGKAQSEAIKAERKRQQEALKNGTAQPAATPLKMPSPAPANDPYDSTEPF